MKAREDALHAAAIERTGYSDFGDDAYREGLGVLLEALEDEADVEGLYKAIERHAVEALTGRLHSQANWKKYPRSLDLSIKAPIFITGLPRTGTSMLHQIMCTDPQFQWMPNWIAAAPQPRPAPEDWATSPDFNAADRSLNEMFNANPLIRAGHNIEAALPEECIRVLMQSFVTMRYVSTLPLPRYERWFFAQDETPSYRRFADNLRLMANGSTLPWLLKNPSHSIGIDALLNAFPDARVVITHRDPQASISSGASIIQRSAGDLWRDQHAIGPHRLRVWAKGAERLERARAARPDQFIEVSYDDLIDDPVAATIPVYEKFGLDRSPEVVAGMQAWLEANPQGKHGAHVYSLEATGLQAQDIATRLAAYSHRYGYAQ